MASPAPWLRWTQTELTRWAGEEEEEEDDDFERRMDEDGVIGLGEFAGNPPWGNGEDLEEGSPAEEGHWHPRQDLEEEEEQGSSGADEGPWGVESDGDPYPELSSEGRWGSGSSSSPETLRDGRDLCQPRGCSTDGGDTSDASPGPVTPSRRHRGWGTARDASEGHGQGWTPSRSIPLHLSTNKLRDAASVEPRPKPQPAGTTGSAPSGEPLPAPQLHNRSQVPKKASPTVLPPKPGRQSPSLSPQQRRTGSKEARDPSGTGTRYGRGQLNHPLPDLSKVEARVKFNQSYRPPRGRALPVRPGVPRGPIGFKSPAEIVREVLLSSGEGVPPQPPTATALPQEFRSPRQATQLVQQLQDDYHKLLTKYAEAENTIDQLRLGARVSLYADLPQPSRSLAVGTMGGTGCRVMTLDIPRAATAALSSATPGGAAPAPGSSNRGGSPQPPCPPPPEGVCATCPGPCCCSGTQLMQTLRGQTHKLQAQVESFEGWLQAGSPVAQEQFQRLKKLKDAQDALERAYLQARQQHPGSSGEFDPDRAVEGEIFHLGLRLDELKEQLEPGARRQPPPQPTAQPCSPPAPSSPPATRSPRPESPVLMEGPRGTTRDSEAVTEGLPRPLWHKQLQVEEDFSDLLEQYKHFKSLPESLSLEQLSLAESRSQEEVDGPGEGDGGASEVPCRTRSQEEGTNLATSPLHPTKRRAMALPPGDPLWPQEARGCLSPATAEEPPATAESSLELPEPPRAPLSHHSSTIAQHRPRKGQRIVSPETDSGFVGSEASRVSPPTHTPEHQPPGTRTPSSLGPSVPIPATLRPLRKREVTQLPSRTAPVGIYPAGGQGDAAGPRLPPSTLSQSSSPPRWAESAGSEAEPDAHTDSEAEGRSCPSTGSHPPATARGPASPPPSPETTSPSPMSPDLPSLDAAHCDLLGSRLERDRAIRALQDEVWRLRRRLEESLRRSRSYPQGKAPLRAPPGRRQPVAGTASSPKDTAPSGEPRPPLRGRAAPGVAPTRRGRSASLPRDRPELDLGCRWDCGDQAGPADLVEPSSAQPQADSAAHPGSHPPSLSSESDPSPAGPRATPSPQKSPGSPPGMVTFQGQYTGTRYRAGTPRTATAPREKPGTPGCPRCHGCTAPSASFWADDAARQPRHSTPRRTRCPACRAPMGAPAPGDRDRATHAEPVPGGTAPPGSHLGPRAEKPEPGLWYLATGPGAPTAISCLAPIPLVPYVPSVLYWSPAVPTSAPALTGVPLHPAAGHQQAEHPPRPPTAAPRRCLSLDLEELEELNRSLSRAAQAAQGVRVTTTRMSRALAAELSLARGPRGSCLF